MDPTPLIALDDARLTLLPGRHPFESDEAEAIDALWARLSAANPRIYDGEAVLFTSARIEGARLTAEAAAIRFAGLTAYIGWDRTLEWRHIFCCAALIGSDGRAVMGRQSVHGLNAGRVYFPSGSLDIGDFPGGVADLDANMARELREETGISLQRGAPEPGLLLWRHGRVMALFRTWRFAETARELAGEIEAHLASGADDELCEAVILEPGQVLDEMAASAKAFMRAFRG